MAEVGWVHLYLNPHPVLSSRMGHDEFCMWIASEEAIDRGRHAGAGVRTLGMEWGVEMGTGDLEWFSSNFRTLLCSPWNGP